MKQIDMGDFAIGGEKRFVLIAGPCVLESEEAAMDTARYLKNLTKKLDISYIFKASYDKANRTSIDSYRGPGVEKGLAVLKEIKEKMNIPLLSDVHRFEEINRAAAILDIVQVPAFLCRQTDFILEIAKKARVINIKKGQFLAPRDVANIIEKAKSTGNDNIMITERGTSFGYNNLVFDIRALPIMRDMGYPVIFDATHAVQFPGGMGKSSGGEREMVSYLARAAVSAGVDGLFLEVHHNPDTALCDGVNSLALDSLEELLTTLLKIDDLVKAERLRWQKDVKEQDQGKAERD